MANISKRELWAIIKTIRDRIKAECLFMRVGTGKTESTSYYATDWQLNKIALDLYRELAGIDVEEAKRKEREKSARKRAKKNEAAETE